MEWHFSLRRSSSSKILWSHRYAVLWPLLKVRQLWLRGLILRRPSWRSTAMRLSKVLISENIGTQYRGSWGHRNFCYRIGEKTTVLFWSSAQSYRDLPIRARITFGRITIVLSVIIWRMIKLSRGACRVKVDSRLVWIRPRSKIESNQKEISLSLSWPQDVIRLSFSHILSNL